MVRWRKGASRRKERSRTKGVVPMRGGVASMEEVWTPLSLPKVEKHIGNDGRLPPEDLTAVTLKQSFTRGEGCRVRI